MGSPGKSDSELFELSSQLPRRLSWMGGGWEGLQGQAGFPELDGILSLSSLQQREESEAQLVFLGDQPSGHLGGWRESLEKKRPCTRCVELPECQVMGVMPGLVIRSRAPVVGSVLA